MWFLASQSCSKTGVMTPLSDSETLAVSIPSKAAKASFRYKFEDDDWHG